jgi:hypothetical protein
MPAKRSAEPGETPVRAGRVSAIKVAKRKAAPEKKGPKKFTPIKSALVLKREEAGKRQARIEARAETLAATKRIVGLEPIATDPADAPARAAIDNQRRRSVAHIAKPEPQPSARIKRTAVDRIDDPPPATGAALVERVTQAVERELSQIEVIVGGHHVKLHQRTEAERRARTLASLARTLSEVRKLRADEHKPKRDDDVPRDLNEFRLELARRLDRLVAEAKAACPDEAEPT